MYVEYVWYAYVCTYACIYACMMFLLNTCDNNWNTWAGVFFPAGSQLVFHILLKEVMFRHAQTSHDDAILQISMSQHLNYHGKSLHFGTVVSSFKNHPWIHICIYTYVTLLVEVDLLLEPSPSVRQDGLSGSCDFMEVVYSGTGQLTCHFDNDLTVLPVFLFLRVIIPLMAELFRLVN